MLASLVLEWMLYFWTAVSLLYFGSKYLAADGTLDCTLCYRHCSTRGQKSIFKLHSPHLSVSVISIPRGKRCLATDAYEHRSKGGAGVWSLADCQGRGRQKSHCGIFKSSRDKGVAATSGQRPTQSATLWREPLQRFTGAIWIAQLFQYMKGYTRYRRPPKCSKAIAAAPLHIKIANTILIVVIAVAQLQLV